jgi:ribonuclease-3
MTPARPFAELPSVLAAVRPELLELAFTHRSLCARELTHEQTNERLEFLGDAVVELVISEYLYNQYPHEDEGMLTRYRSALVRTESLALVARELHLDEFLRTTWRPAAGPESFPDSVLANTFEAVTGALYLDKGLPVVRTFLAENVLRHFATFVANTEAKDAKTLLQEKVQALGKPAPVYTTLKAEGPDHAKTFTIQVSVPDYEPQTGAGLSKQKAQQEAATHFLEQYFSE